MNKLNAIEKADFINKKYVEYLLSSFEFGNPKLQNEFKVQLSKEALFRGPFVNMTLPFKKEANIKQLVEGDLVSQSFLKLGNVDFNRPLYSHQEEAIRHIAKGRGAIITTGTGSGKTESFLYPIFNEIFKDFETGNCESGIRALFLYPMNALVNDQMDRVRSILKEVPEITFGFFTGDTEEKESIARRKKIENHEDIPINELISREAIRENPPHLLFTNYSMLEYLLIRPNDCSIFDVNSLKHWKFVVLDEAHTYKGALGIELAFLMRRVTGLAPNKPNFILTSATLGKQGESEDDIVIFANRLTSSNFNKDDIIFSKRVEIPSTPSPLEIEGNDYTKLYNNLENIDSILEISSKYCSPSSFDTKEIIFDILSRDNAVKTIYKLLKDNSINFSNICENLTHLSSEQVSILVDLINFAEKNGVGLFDLKYHSFIRPISGAFITLEEPKKLSLIHTSDIDDKKAFEVGNCKYCNSMYIFGKMQKNRVDNLYYLTLNSEVDIYENYGDNEFVKIDYFLVENNIHESQDSSTSVEYTVCSECGCIYESSNIIAEKCSCVDSKKVSIYKIDMGDDNLGSFNNLNHCICCGSESKSGIVKSLNLGKDEATAIISQILYEAIEDVEPKAEEKPKLLLGNPVNLSSNFKKNNVKQFISFSDSRQQASFYALFLNESHERMLRKRLIWELLETNGHEEVRFAKAVSILCKNISQLELFDNGMNAEKNAWITLLVDLLKVDGVNDGEGLGLYYFDLDLDFISQLPESNIESYFGKYNLNKNDLHVLLQVILRTFKVTPAIDYTESTLSFEEKRDKLEYRRFDNYVALKTENKKGDVKSFLPLNSRENAVVEYVRKVCRCDFSDAKQIIEVLFNLCVNASVFTPHPLEQKYKINAERYILKSSRKNQYYRCKTCGTFSPYNIHDICSKFGCEGEVEKVDPDRLLNKNYYRNEYMTKKVEKIVVKEHTAQLERKIAKKYQTSFKEKKINILSCSTTFEMGIDIGNLETVLMRNVPPSPSNYVQRAGRAGRRKDSSAFILTYCGTNSHDYTFFQDPNKMISGLIQPPFFIITNDKILVRHLMATCLGYFFRKYTNFFKNIESFLYNGGLSKFYEYMETSPQDLNEFINNKILSEDQFEKYRNFSWLVINNNKDDKMEIFKDIIDQMKTEYETAIQKAKKNEDYTTATYCQQQLNDLLSQNLISQLSKYCVIPKYGFPVDNVELKVFKDGRPLEIYDLSRDLKIGISEYAPDSEIIVDGKKFRSKYIRLPKHKSIRENYYFECVQCKRINIHLTKESCPVCTSCGTQNQITNHSFYITPEYGFMTGKNVESARLKPKKSYSGDITYIGLSNEHRVNSTFNDVIDIETVGNDKLLVMNKSSFYICDQCGYSEIIKEKTVSAIPGLTKKVEHMTPFQNKCLNKSLRYVQLGHTFTTDVAKISSVIFSRNGHASKAKLLSFMYAFLEGICETLTIERTNIDGILIDNLDLGTYDIVIYDNVPGGAGHVKKMVEHDVIKKALELSYNKVNYDCCDENESCYNCLRNFYNQKYHTKLSRKYAKELITQLLEYS